MARRFADYRFTTLAAFALLVAVIVAPCRQALGIPHSGTVKRTRLGIAPGSRVGSDSFGHAGDSAPSGSPVVKGEIDEEVKDDLTFGSRPALSTLEIPPSPRPQSVRDRDGLPLSSPSRPLRC